jgi:hypothetical protein
MVGKRSKPNIPTVRIKMVGKHSKPTEPPNTPPVTVTPADGAPAITGNDTANTDAQTPPVHPVSNYNTVHSGDDVALGGCPDVIQRIQAFLFDKDRGHYRATSQFHRDNEPIIVQRLLQAVAYGMESKEANVPVSASDKGNLFKSHLHAKDLLQKFPAFLLARGDVADWAGRTFRGITAFEYALWAKDFKMMDMIIKCLNEAKISEEERERIRTELLKQYEQVTLPQLQGGGLTYTHIYERPNMDAQGIPQKDASGHWDCETVTVERDENHFDLTPLIGAYEDYERNFDRRTWSERDACLIKAIGACQRHLPVHILQRYCDLGTPFYPLPQFNGEFKRSAVFYKNHNESHSSLFGSSLSSDFALLRGVWAISRGAVPGECVGFVTTALDLEALRQLDEVSTNEIEKITQQLSQPRHAAGPRS